MSTPRVDVLLPYRNAAATITEALESMLIQERVNVRIIAIDDGSTDDGPSRVAALVAGHDNIVWATTPGVGIVGALEEGRKHVEAPWVARMDADDISHPERLRAQITLLESDSTLGAVGTWTQLMPANVDAPGLRLYLEWQNSLITPAEHARDIFVEAPFCHPSVTMRREALERAGGYHDVTWAEDYDLWLRMHACGYGLAKVPRFLFFWRHHPGQLTWKAERYTEAQFRAARAHYLAPLLHLQDRPIVIWGAGPTGRRFARALGTHGITPSRFVDIDHAKIGRIAQGKRIVGPDALVRGEDLIVTAVGARGARGLIRTYLLAKGFIEGTDFIVAS